MLDGISIVGTLADDMSFATGVKQKAVEPSAYEAGAYEMNYCLLPLNLWSS